MTRRQVLQAAAAAPAVSRAQNLRRNVIFILSDDHRYNAMGALGHPWLQTPHLDRMLRQGACFRNAFVTTSLCSPSRASILTGQYGHSHRVLGNETDLPPSTPTFPVEFQRRGYRTAFIGKWHMGYDRDDPRPGFDHWVGFTGLGDYFDQTMNFNGSRRLVKGYNPDVLTEESLRFLRENRTRPFLLYLSHKSVHHNFSPAPKYRGCYAHEQALRPASMGNEPAHYRGKPDWVRRQRNSWHGVDGMYGGSLDFDGLYRAYYECIRSLDDSIGAVLEGLEAHGLLNDTLVVYSSDNGFMLGEHGLIDKRCMYEPSMRVPMLAHCPDLFGGGRTVDGMALNIDIAPTLLAAAGAPAPPGMQGQSLLPLLTGNAAGWRTEFLYEYFWERMFPQTPSVVGLRTDRYSFMRYHGVWDLDELYDIREDPAQTNNLLGDVRLTRQVGSAFWNMKDSDPRKELVTGLQRRIDNVMRQTGGNSEPSWSDPYSPSKERKS